MKEMVRTIEINGEMVKVVNVYEVCPVENQKSFYGKAKVFELENDMRVLKSYDTFVLIRDGDKFMRLWNGWSLTTGKHIYIHFVEYVKRSGTICHVMNGVRCNNGRCYRQNI